MSYEHITVELLVNIAAWVDLEFKILTEFLKHIFQNLMFDFTRSSQDFDRDRFVDWQDFLDSWATVLGDNSANFLKLSLFEVDAAVFDEEFV